MESISTSTGGQSKSCKKFSSKKDKTKPTILSEDGLPSKKDDSQNNSIRMKKRKHKNMDKNNNENDDKSSRTKHNIEENDIVRNKKIRNDDINNSIRLDAENVRNGKIIKEKVDKSGDELKSKISCKEKRKKPTDGENNLKKDKKRKKHNKKNTIQEEDTEVKSGEVNHELENNSKCLESKISAVTGRKKRKTEERILENKKSKNMKNSSDERVEDIDDNNFLMNTTDGSKENMVSESCVNTNSVGNAVGSTKIFVGGLPFSTSEDDVIDHFSSCGVVKDVHFLKFPDSGEFRGSALVNFETQEAARSALEFDGYFIESHNLYLKVMPYNPKKGMTFYPKRVEGCNKVYLGNLPWDTTEYDLWKLFSDLNVAQVRLGKDKQTGNFRGYAHVDFADDISLNKALHMDQIILSGRVVKIACAMAPTTHNKS